MAAQDPNQTVNQQGYQLTFYRGFCSRAAVSEANGPARTLFTQSGRYNLPAGQRRPDGRHVLRLQGGAHNQNLSIAIDDPELRIARITIELYQQPYNETMGRQPGEAVETLELDNQPRICPPDC
jgi:hypothetical protein